MASAVLSGVALFAAGPADGAADIVTNLLGIGGICDERRRVWQGIVFALVGCGRWQRSFEASRYVT